MKRSRLPRRNRDFVVLGVVGLWLCACSIDNTKKNFLGAENLWSSGNYKAAAAEFEKVYRKDTKGELGMRALSRLASTQTLFLKEHGDALKNYKLFLQSRKEGSEAWNAELEIGEIYFNKLMDYEAALAHYQSLSERFPNAREAAEISYRIAKSHFFLWRFQEALTQFQNVIDQFPDTRQAEKSAYEIGLTLFTGAEHLAREASDLELPLLTGAKKKKGTKDTKKEEKPSDFKRAILAFQSFIARHPTSEWIPAAHFGIASCLEELDQLDLALQEYQGVLATHPSPNSVRVKIIRLRERLQARSRTAAGN